MNQDIKTLAMRFIEAFNRHDAPSLDELIAADYVQYSPGVPPGRLALTMFVKGVFTAFPDGRFLVDDMIAEGDKVLLRWRFQGHNTGKWMGYPPTHKWIEFWGMDLWRYNQEGKLAEAWFMTDRLGLMQQLGLVPGSQPVTHNRPGIYQAGK